MRYLLPCECGRTIPVATTQAGEYVACECGRSLLAPTLREMRTLQAAPEVEAAPRRLSWSYQQGLLYSIGGVLVLLAAIVLGMTSLSRSTLITDQPQIDPQGMEAHLAEIDANSPEQNLEVWKHEILEHGLERPPDQPWLLHRRYARTLTRVMIVASVVGSIGLAMVLAAFVLRPKRRM